MTESLPGTVDAAVPGTTIEHEPQWLRALAFASAAAVAAFGGVGLALADAGVYRSYFVFPLGAVVWFALLALARPILLARGATNARAHVVGAIGVLFVAAMTFWNARHASQHVLINRDPGVYVNAGRWIALHGNLRVHAAVGPFGSQPGLVFKSFGMHTSGRGFLSFQFAHLLPALLAEAHDLGADRLMFVAGPALGGVALLAFFVAAWRLVREPFVALFALVAFAFLLPQISFSRDAFSEIPMQVLLFSALWILADRRAFRRPRVAFVAGFLLGMMQAARIDALVALTGLALLFAAMWLLADVHNRRAVARSAGACALGLVPGLALGAVDVSLRSHQYLHDLHGQVRSLVLLMVGSIVVALVLVAAVPVVARRISRVPDWVGWAAGALVALVLFGLWFVRPAVQHVHGAKNPLIEGLQRAAHAKVDPTRTYADRSMMWLSWYLGPIALATAIVAAALFVRMLVRGRMWFAFAGVALLAPASAVYLWRPNITTDQIWVMRRYMFSALPLFVLLAFGLVAALVRVRTHRVPVAAVVAIAVVLAGFAVSSPLRALKPVPSISEERVYPVAVRDACHTVGRDAAIVLLQGKKGLLSQWAPQTLRGWCNVPVAVMVPTPTSASALAHLSAAWSAAGRRLWVVADDPATITTTLPAAKPQATPVAINPYLLEMALLHRPGSYSTQQFSLVLAPVDNA